MKEAPFIDIAHFGSTSVKGMLSKPVIDILIGQKEFYIKESILLDLEKIGYEYFGKTGIPGKLYIRKRNSNNFNLCVTRFNSKIWKDNLLIRDFLRKNITYQKKYITLKQDAVNNGYNTLLTYSKHKKIFMTELLKAAAANIT